MSAHCASRARRLATLTRANHDLRSLARLAARPGIAGERAQRLVPERKAQVEESRALLAEHEASCTDCAGVTA